MFIAPKGRKLIAVDYSQIDLRILAHFSKDKTMVDDFKKGVDFHSATAARILGKKIDKVTKDDRRIAKTINFGVIYGMSAFGLSESLGVSREEAGEYIEEYFVKHSGVKAFFEESLEFVREHGYIMTMFGRCRFIPGVVSNNRVVRSASEREAINLPIQGSSADIMRLAAVDVYDWILNSGLDVKFILQIHDELVFECDDDVVGEVTKNVKQIMEEVVKLDVPLHVSVSSGMSLLE